MLRQRERKIPTNFQAQIPLQKFKLPRVVRRTVIAPAPSKQELDAAEIEAWAKHAMASNGFGGV